MPREMVVPFALCQFVAVLASAGDCFCAFVGSEEMVVFTWMKKGDRFSHSVIVDVIKSAVGVVAPFWLVEKPTDSIVNKKSFGCDTGSANLCAGSFCLCFNPV